MKYSKRRYEAGKMLMDVTKYLLTIGLIGGILTNKLTSLSAVLIIFAVINIVHSCLFHYTRRGGINHDESLYHACRMHHTSPGSIICLT